MTHSFPLDGAVFWAVLDRLSRSQTLRMYLSPSFLVPLAAILVVERWIPARRDQGIVSVGFLQDAVYFPVTTAVRLTLIAAYLRWLQLFYDQFLAGLTIESVAAWPPYARAGLAIVAGDFLEWLHHWVRHKVPLFWYFHTIHHSQRQLNLFSDVRYHPVEYLVSSTITAVPMFMLHNAFPIAVAYSLVHEWYTKLYHGNVRTNLGMLRYVLVTPQSHRIHHSVEARHQDKNFGVLFSIWDYLFATQHRRYEEYPDTGIADPTFPHERSVRGFHLVTTPVRQFVYPFRLMARRS